MGGQATTGLILRASNVIHLPHPPQRAPGRRLRAMLDGMVCTISEGPLDSLPLIVQNSQWNASERQSGGTPGPPATFGRIIRRATRTIFLGVSPAER